MPSAARTRPPSAEALYAIIRHVRPLYRHCHKLVEENLAGTGISVGMRAVLERLRDGGPQTVPQIARGLMIQRQYIQRVVNELLEGGYVQRARNAAHKRSWLIQPTPKGLAAFEDLHRLEAANLERVATALDASDVETCHRVLAYLSQSFAALVREDPSEDPEP